MRPAAWCAALLVAVATASAATLAQEDFLRRGRRRAPIPADSNYERTAYDGQLAFVRLRYSMGGALGGFDGFMREPPWAHDYPRAERNLMLILQELTLIKPHVSESNILTLDDAHLFNFPIAYMSEPGFWTMNDSERDGLRQYLAKGGFVIFDDFRGDHWYNFEAQMRQVMPEGRLIELDSTHPIFHSFFEINKLDTLDVYGVTPTYYGMYEDNDLNKRLLLIANYNNDLGEYMEFSDTGFAPVDQTNDAYKFAINYIVYGMTH